MKQLITIHGILLLFILFPVCVHAQPGWSVDPNQYQYSMTFTTVLKMGSKESTDTTDMIAAFKGNECRGVVKPIYNPAVNRYIAFLMVYANQIEGDTLTFKVYHSNKEKTKALFNHVPFQPNASFGNPANPLVNLVEKKITAYNFFSPNNDQYNDEWKIENTALYQDFEVSVFNVIGERVFHKKNKYQNDWTGIYSNEALPEGTYYYILKSPDGRHLYKGSIALIR